MEEFRMECERLGKQPTALKILDTVFRNDDLFDLAKIQMYANYLVRAKPQFNTNTMFHDAHTQRLIKNLKLVGLHTAQIDKKAEFVRKFIYEYTVLNLLNEEYEVAMEDAPKEVFVEGRIQNLKLKHDFTPQIPEVSKNLSCATLECKLMDQMYRYRAAFFKRQGKVMAVKRDAKRPMEPEEMLILNMDVSATVYNMVDSVAK